MFNPRLLKLVPLVKRYIAADVVMQWLALLANIALFVSIGFFFEQVLRGSATYNSLGFLCVGFVVVLALRFIFQRQAQIMGQKASYEAKTTIRQAVYDKLIALGPSYQENISTAKAVQISVEGVEHLESYFGQYLPQLFYSILAPITLFVCLAPLSLPAAGILLLCVPFIPLSIVAVQKIARRVMGNYWNSYTDLGETFLESIQGLTTLKVFNADEYRHKKMNKEAETFRQATMRLLRMQLNSITVMDLFAYGGAAVGICVSLYQFAAGQTSFAATFALVFLSVEFFLPLRALGSFFHTAMSGMAAADTIFELLDTPEKPQGTQAINPQNTEITCINLTYCYQNREVDSVKSAGSPSADNPINPTVSTKRNALENVNFHAPKGSFVGITGKSGSGKSTLAGILAGINTSYEGTVEIGGINLKDISRVSLRETITYVPFSGYLFKGTLRSNLLFSKPNASDEELWIALEKANLASFVKTTGGLDMPLSPEGKNLSGGQRQRVVMARALLHNTPLYIFDEATSNIDVESELAILETIYDLAKTKTVIMISHRLATLQKADTIYVFNQGKVAEVGTHAELSESNGIYSQLWAEQAQLESFTQQTSNSSNDNQEAAPQDSLEQNTNPANEILSCAANKASSLTDTASATNAAGALSSTPAIPQKQGYTDAASGRSKTPATAPRKRSNLSIMANLVKLTKPLLPVMALAVVLGIGGFCAAIFLTVFASYAMLDIQGRPSGIPFDAALVALVICGILRGPLRYGEQICNHYLAFKILALVRDRVFSVLRKLAPAKLEGRDKGNLVSLITSDVELLEVFYAHTLSPAIIALVMSIGMTIFIGSQSLVLGALAALSYLTIGVIVPWTSSAMNKNRGQGIRKELGELNTFILDSLRGLNEILQFGREKSRKKELVKQMKQVASYEKPLKTQTATALSLTGAIVMLFDLVMIALSSELALAGAISFENALIATAALISSFGPVIAVANLGSTLQQTLASGARVLDLLEEKPRITEIEDGINLRSFTGASLHNVDFSYNSKRVLSNVTFSIQKESVTQISGESGAGKSTLLKLLMRFWDPDKGVIEISQSDIARINTKNLRANESFMEQETYLFNTTIKENLLFAKQNATDKELWSALEKASLAPFVRSLPQGLDTSVGSLGDSLSGGERQRLGLARVFLHDAPFVLLDEPTSNLDSLNEAAILKALSQHKKNETIVLVSHRPSAQKIADQTYLING